MSWIAAIDYSQGTSHRRDGIPCQDYGRIVQPHEDLVIAAVSDGAGSAPHSRVGARIAANTASEWLEARIQDYPGMQGRVSDLATDDLFDGLTGVVQAALNAAANDNGHVISDYACTLTVLAMAPNEVSAAQIGDGFVVTRLEKDDYTLLIEPDRGEYVNETSFVTDADARDRVVLGAQTGPVRFISAATDGLLPVVLDTKRHVPHRPFFAPIDEFTRNTDSAVDVHDGLRDFLRSDRLTTLVEDDLTLMVCGWQS